MGYGVDMSREIGWIPTQIKKIFGFGNWRVIYPDEKQSMPMRYDTAKDYAKMFVGKVVPTDSKIFHLGLR